MVKCVWYICQHLQKNNLCIVNIVSDLHKCSVTLYNMCKVIMFTVSSTDVTVMDELVAAETTLLISSEYICRHFTTNFQ